MSRRYTGRGRGFPVSAPRLFCATGIAVAAVGQELAAGSESRQGAAELMQTDLSGLAAGAGSAIAAACPRRACLGALALVVAASLVAVSPVMAQGQGSKRPNVVLVMTDDQDEATMPIMDAVRRQIGRRGTSFENAFATFPLCCPSRASVLTGQYSHNHGVISNTGPNGGFKGFNDRGSLPIALRRDGYRTGFVGKYLNGYSTGPERPIIPRGWDEWYSPWGNRAVKMFDYDLNENGRVRSYGHQARDYQTDVFADKATSFIRRGAEKRKPFFLALWTGAPHTENRTGADPRPAPRHEGAFRGLPLSKPPSFNERDVSDKPAPVRNIDRLDRTTIRKLTQANRDRRASLLAVDDAVRSVVTRLRRSGELDDTLIIYTTDNGFLLGLHRMRGKFELYEESAGVPLLMRGPGMPAGAVRRQMVGNIDLAPTILDLVGATPRRTPDGISLLPLARSGDARRDRDILLENTATAAVRTPDYMYAKHENGDEELYDLRSDPFQLESLHVGGPPFRDLGPDQQTEIEATQRRLAERLRELRDCAGRTCR